MRVLLSAVRPEKAQAMGESISTIFSIEVGSINGEVILFSTARITPSDVWIPMAVEPNLIASMAYSTWKRRPSGEKVFGPRSYSDLLRNMLELMKCLLRSLVEVNQAIKAWSWPSGEKVF